MLPVIVLLPAQLNLCDADVASRVDVVVVIFPCAKFAVAAHEYLAAGFEVG